MFEKVLIDFYRWPDVNYDERQIRLFPFLYLIADEVIESGYEGDTKQRPPFVTQAMGIAEGRPNIYDFAQNNEGIYFSPSKETTGKMLVRQGLTMQNALLMLACAGLDITVPNLTLDIARSEEIQIVKIKLEEERREYLVAIAKIADETYDRLVQGYYVDTVDWALNEAFIKIKPKAEKFQAAMRKLDKSLLQRVTFNFFTEGIPTIGSVFLSEGWKDGAARAVEAVLETLCKNLGEKIEERKMPEVVYGMKLSKGISPLR